MKVARKNAQKFPALTYKCDSRTPSPQERLYSELILVVIWIGCEITSRKLTCAFQWPTCEWYITAGDILQQTAANFDYICCEKYINYYATILHDTKHRILQQVN